MIGMYVRVDHITDGLLRTRAYGFAQRHPHQITASTIDNSHGFVTDDETDIGNIPMIVVAEFFMRALMHKHTGGDFFHRQRG